MGDIYLASDPRLKRSVAIKRLARKLVSDAANRQHFLKEAERASALNSPHIAAVYDVLEEDDELYLVMEYVEGSTLRERLSAPIGPSRISGNRRSVRGSAGDRASKPTSFTGT